MTARTHVFKRSNAPFYCVLCHYFCLLKIFVKCNTTGQWRNDNSTIIIPRDCLKIKSMYNAIQSSENAEQITWCFLFPAAHPFRILLGSRVDSYNIPRIYKKRDGDPRARFNCYNLWSPPGRCCPFFCSLGEYWKREKISRDRFFYKHLFYDQ